MNLYRRGCVLNNSVDSCIGLTELFYCELFLKKTSIYFCCNYIYLYLTNNCT